jgi:hypothetical protein
MIVIGGVCGGWIVAANEPAGSAWYRGCTRVASTETGPPAAIVCGIYDELIAERDHRGKRREAIIDLDDLFAAPMRLAIANL